MNWFRVDVGVDDHPKIFKLASAIGIDMERALGRMLRLWSKVAEYAEDGDLTHVSDEQIAGWMGWKKPAHQLVDLLVTCGLMSRDPKREVYGWYERHKYMLSERNRKAEMSQARKAEREEARAESARKARQGGARATRAPSARKARPTSPLLSSPLPGSYEPDVTPTPLGDELARKWNDLAGALGLGRVEIPLAKCHAADAGRAAPEAMARWADIAAALKAPVNDWHVKTKAATFEWLCQKRQPWKALISKANAPQTRSQDEVDWDEIERRNRELHPGSYAEEGAA